MKRCISAAREMGYKSIYLESMPELNKAVGLYEQFGFTHLDAPLGNTGHFGCDIWMMKSL
jgi:putative acetyltransferase